MIQGYIICRLGAIPTTIKSSKGRDFKTFSVACDGFENGKKITQWVRVSVFDSNLFKKVDSLNKGSMVNVFGNIRINSYNGKDGSFHAGFDIIASSVEFINTGRGNTVDTEEADPNQFNCGKLEPVAAHSSDSSTDIPF